MGKAVYILSLVCYSPDIKILTALSQWEQIGLHFPRRTEFTLFFATKVLNFCQAAQGSGEFPTSTEVTTFNLLFLSIYSSLYASGQAVIRSSDPLRILLYPFYLDNLSRNCCRESSPHRIIFTILKPRGLRAFASVAALCSLQYAAFFIQNSNLFHCSHTGWVWVTSLTSCTSIKTEDDLLCADYTPASCSLP